MQIYLHFEWGFSVHRRDGAWQPASFFYGIDHTWAIKTQAVCFSFPCLHGGDDEAAESGAEMVVRLGDFLFTGGTGLDSLRLFSMVSTMHGR